MDDKKIEELLPSVESEAKENIKGLISEKAIGYKRFLYGRMIRIFKEKYDIDWTPPFEDDKVTLTD